MRNTPIERSVCTRSAGKRRSASICVARAAISDERSWISESMRCTTAFIECSCSWLSYKNIHCASAIPPFRRRNVLSIVFPMEYVSHGNVYVISDRPKQRGVTMNDRIKENQTASQIANEAALDDLSPRVPSSLPKASGLYWGGKWHTPSGAATLACMNPSTGKPLRDVLCGGTEEVSAAVAAARGARDTWARTPPLERARACSITRRNSR